MIGGAQGKGIDTAANLFGNAVAKAGYYIYGNREYYSNIKGRHSYFNLTISDRRVNSVSNRVEVLVTFDAETVFQHFTEVKGHVIYDQSQEGVRLEQVQSMEPELMDEVVEVFKDKGYKVAVKDLISYLQGRGVKAVAVNYDAVLKQVAGRSNLALSVVDRARNTIGIAASCSLLGLKQDFLLQAIKESFRNETYYKFNAIAAEIAYSLVSPEYDLKPIPVSGSRVIIDGNTAAAMGKIAGGLRFQTYYPITPASDESVYIEANQVVDMIDPETGEMRKGGIVVVQTEDELAAINMAVGASLTGTRAATATSGPGFSLMSEGLSWAGMNEAPVVITYYMRGAPATGQPTRSGQADLLFAMNAGHGEFPRIVIASGDHVEVFHDAFLAMNLAEKYQSPVVHIVEKALANAYSLVEEELLRPGKVERGKFVPEPSQDYARFKFQEDGISPRAPLGKASMIYTGDEHNEEGHIREATRVRNLMVEKRMRKLGTADREIPGEVRYSVYGDSKVALLSWGSPKGAILDAMEELERDGIKVELVQLRIFNPFPRTLGKALQGKDRIIAVENNYTAQGAQVVKLRTGVEPTNYILKWSGRPMARDEVAEAVKKVLERDEKRVVLSGGM